jgi:hypothetical protein
MQRLEVKYGNQKDNTGEQVTDGNYSFNAEFEISGRVHPVWGPSVEIVEDLCRNIKTSKMMFYKFFNKFPNAFPLLKLILV